ncbi:MAG: hypothetical protein NZ933_07535 [Bacteroidia bacterium]|nr:hypothetical protein [Bacteroidia bacterium]
MRGSLWGVVFLGIILTLACKREKRDGHSDMGHAGVTTIEVYLVEGRDTIKGRYKDPDGPGGRLPSVDTLKPSPDRTYNYFVRVLNESGNPISDLTGIIFEQQKNTHRLFLLPNPETLATIEPTDSDDLGRPVGGKGTWRQSTATLHQGSVRLILRHYLNPNDKNYGLERGSTDLDVSLPVKPL